MVTFDQALAAGCETAIQPVVLLEQ